MSEYDYERSRLEQELDDERVYRERDARAQQSRLESSYREQEAEIESLREEHETEVEQLAAGVLKLIRHIEWADDRCDGGKLDPGFSQNDWIDELRTAAGAAVKEGG